MRRSEWRVSARLTYDPRRRWTGEDDPALLDYGAYDVIITTRLFHWYLEHMDDHELTELLDIERRVAHTAFTITMRGIDVDMQRARKVRDDLTGRGRQVRRSAGSLRRYEREVTQTGGRCTTGQRCATGTNNR